MKNILITVFLFSINVIAFAQASSWKECQKDKKGTIIIRYHYAEYFINENAEGKVEGIEADLITAFADFVEKKYDISLELKFEKGIDFPSLYQEIKNAPAGVFGLSNYSITPQRLKELQFSPPYMPDIEVLVCSPNIPIATSEKELLHFLKRCTALEFPGTTLAENIAEIKKSIPLLKVIKQTENILGEIAENENLFTYTELPIYIEELRKGAKLKRQNFLKVNRIGYGIIFSKQSDWDKPINAFFESPNFKSFINETIKRHFGDTKELLWEVSDNSQTPNETEVSILMKEKEIQRGQLLAQEMKLVKDQFRLNFLIIVLISSVTIAFILVWTNIDRQKKNNILKTQKDVIVEKNKALQQFNEEKGALMDIVAHDLKSPLNNIKGLLQLLPLEGDLNEMQKENLALVQKTVSKGRKLVSELLEVSTLEQGKIEIKLEEINVYNFLISFLKPYKNTAADKQIVIHALCKKKHLLFTDINILERILDNLLSNAIKFSEKEKAIYLEISEGENTQFLVRDEGPGISEADQKKMFKKFQKLTARPTAGESSNGLGLAIVKLLVEQLKGKITVNSQLGKGTEFQLIFPK